VVVEREGGVTRVIVAMQRWYAPVPRWVLDLDLLSVVVAPIWWVGALVVRTCLRLPTPPRAVFEVTEERFKMSLCDSGSGARSEFDWPRSAVVEARANRFEKGLWVNVTGQVKETYLKDVPGETIQRIEAALRGALDVWVAEVSQVAGLGEDGERCHGN